MTPLFRKKVAEYGPSLMSDFDLSEIEAAAVFGNLGHECNGFKTFQEAKPLVPGSAGGFGWAQWTGPRRRLFEAYCARNELDPKSDDANYGFLWTELKGPEKKAIPAVKRAGTLAQKVKAFEAAFERAGVKHYDSRNRWAEAALKVLQVEQPGEDTAVAGVSSESIRIIQQLLRDKGWPEVGNVDGKMGGPQSRTYGAIAAATLYYGWSPVPKLGGELISKLADAPKRELSAARTTATAADLKDSKSIKLGSQLKTAGSSVAVLSGLGGALTGVSSFEDVRDRLDTAQAVYSALGTAAPYIIGVVGGGFALWWGQRWIREQVRAYRAGNHV